MTPPKHIAIVFGSLRAGGAEKAMIRLANGFAEKNISTDIIVTDTAGEFVSLISPLVRLISLGKKRARNSVMSFAKYIDENSPDVLIVAQTHIHLMTLLALKLSSRKAILILSEHSTYSLNNRGFQKMLSRILFSRANAITVTSAGAATDFKNSFPHLNNKVSVIPNIIDAEEISRLSREEVSHPFLSQKHSPVILTAGRLTKSKNIKLLIDAFYNTIKQTCAKLIIAGDGEEKIRLEKYVAKLGIQEHVSFAGFLPNPYSFMRRCDLFVMSSMYEGLPTVLIEALCCDCKIISTDSPGGAAEILDYGRLGILVPVNDTAALGNAIVKSLSENELTGPEAFSASAYRSDTIISDYLTLIDRVTAN